MATIVIKVGFMGSNQGTKVKGRGIHDNLSANEKDKKEP